MNSTPTLDSAETEPVPRVSRRRTNAMTGWVNFPVESLDYRSSKEGGMFVKLVVADNRDYDESPWNNCCGVGVVDLLSECFIGDDQAPSPDGFVYHESQTAAETMAQMEATDQAQRDWDTRHFPLVHSKTTEVDQASVERYLSRGYLAAVVLGSTGWSGFSDTEGSWKCTFQDLTPDGQALYHQMEALYPGCTLHLLTFLDT